VTLPGTGCCGAVQNVPLPLTGWHKTIFETTGQYTYLPIYAQKVKGSNPLSLTRFNVATFDPLLGPFMQQLGRSSIAPGVYPVPQEIDWGVGRLKVFSMNINTLPTEGLTARYNGHIINAKSDEG